ncbi:YciC family protein [Ancylomarina sp.]|uniref:YciC family protein n=1 Tax=Ancylomarina sp. TaxID=1970196 RepID=UPI00356AD141
MKLDYCKDDMILKVYPTVSACFEEAFSLMKKHFWMLILIIFVGAAIETPMWLMQQTKPSADGIDFTFSFLQLIQVVYYFGIATVYSYGVIHVFTKVARKKDFVFEETLLGFRTYSRVILSRLLVMLVVGLGLILLLIPGLFLACRLVFVPYLIMDKKHGVVDSLKISYYMTRGYFGTIFGMGILSFVIIILGLVLLGFGILISLVWINTAFAVFYNAAEDLHYIDACKEADVVPEEKEVA